MTADTKKKKKRNFYREKFLLEPGQSTEQYYKLLTQWNKKLATSGLSDIEFITNEGITSPFFTDYPTTALARSYTWDKEQYYRVASTIFWHYPWREEYGWFRFRLLKYIWGKHAEGLELKEIMKLVKRRWKNKQKPGYGTSIFWVHTTLKTMKPQVFGWYHNNLHLFQDQEMSLSDKILLEKMKRASEKLAK